MGAINLNPNKSGTRETPKLSVHISFGSEFWATDTETRSKGQQVWKKVYFFRRLTCNVYVGHKETCKPHNLRKIIAEDHVSKVNCFLCCDHVIIELRREESQ